MSQTSANHPLDLRDPEDIPNSQPVEQAALEYRQAVEYFETNEAEIMRRWKSWWACNRRKERAS